MPDNHHLVSPGHPVDSGRCQAIALSWEALAREVQTPALRDAYLALSVHWRANERAALLREAGPPLDGEAPRRGAGWIPYFPRLAWITNRD
jgi:hypothetical protein